jgi:hypothetical protein
VKIEDPEWEIKCQQSMVESKSYPSHLVIKNRKGEKHMIQVQTFLF